MPTMTILNAPLRWFVPVRPKATYFLLTSVLWLGSISATPPLDNCLQTSARAAPGRSAGTSVVILTTLTPKLNRVTHSCAHRPLLPVTSSVDSWPRWLNIGQIHLQTFRQCHLRRAPWRSCNAVIFCTSHRSTHQLISWLRVTGLCSKYWAP